METMDSPALRYPPAVPMLFQLPAPFVTPLRMSLHRLLEEEDFLCKLNASSANPRPVSSQPCHWFGVPERKPFLIPSQITRVALKHQCTVTRLLRMAQASSDMACGVKRATTNSKTYRTTDPRTWENHQHPGQQARTFKSLPETC